MEPRILFTEFKPFPPKFYAFRLSKYCILITTLRPHLSEFCLGEVIWMIEDEKGVKTFTENTMDGLIT